MRPRKSPWSSDSFLSCCKQGRHNRLTNQLKFMDNMVQVANTWISVGGLMHRTMPRRGERKTLMFLATFPDEIQSMTHDYLSDEIFLRINLQGEDQVHPEGAVADPHRQD